VIGRRSWVRISSFPFLSDQLQLPLDGAQSDPQLPGDFPIPDYA
jgi:hypothetical protein